MGQRDKNKRCEFRWACREKLTVNIWIKEYNLNKWDGKNNSEKEDVDEEEVCENMG